MGLNTVHSSTGFRENFHTQSFPPKNVEGQKVVELPSLNRVFDKRGNHKFSFREVQRSEENGRLISQLRHLSKDEFARILLGIKHLYPNSNELSFEQFRRILVHYFCGKKMIEAGEANDLVSKGGSPHRPTKARNAEREEGKLAKLNGEEYIEELCSPLKNLLRCDEYNKLVDSVKNYLKRGRTERKDNFLETICNAFRFGTVYPFRKMGMKVPLTIDGCSFDYNEIYYNVSNIYSIIGDVREALNYRHKCTDIDRILGFHDIILNNEDNILNRKFLWFRFGSDHNLAKLLSATKKFVAGEVFEAVDDFFNIHDAIEENEKEKAIRMHTAYMSFVCNSVIAEGIVGSDVDISGYLKFMSVFLKEASECGSEYAGHILKKMEESEGNIN